MNEPTVTLPLGYVAITLDEYKIMVDKIARFNADMADEIRAATEKSGKQISDLKARIEKLSWDLDVEKKAHADLQARNNDLSEKCHDLNETVYALKKEISALNEELLAMDEIHEIQPNSHAVHQES